jgi:hypothetical protein
MGLATLFQSRPIASLREASPSYLFGYAFFAFVVAWLLELVLPVLPPPLGRLHLWVPLLVFAAKALAHLPGWVANTLRVFSGHAGGSAPAPARPSALTAALHFDRALRRSFVAWLCRRQPPPRPAGQAFSYLEQGSYSTVTAILLVVCLIELPIDTMIASLFVHEPGARNVVHVVCAIAGVYSLACVLGDRWMLRGGQHVLTNTCFDMRVGERSACVVPLDAIGDCEVLGETQVQWCKQHALDVRATLSVTPVDRPNVVLRLKPDAGVIALQYGHQIGGISAVFLYLDRPGTLAAALAAARRTSVVA